MNDVAQNVALKIPYGPVWERIKSITGWSKHSDLAVFLNITGSTVSGARSRDSFPVQWAFKIAQDYNQSTDWLLTGEQEDTSKGNISSQSSEVKSEATTCACDVDLVFVPRVKAKLSAGNGSLLTEDNIVAQYAFRSDWLHAKGQPTKMVILFVTGTSMQPEIYDNDMAMIDQSQVDVIPGKIYAIAVDDTIIVKYVDIEPGKIILRSENEKYPPIYIERKDTNQIRILGKVVWTAREY